MHSQELACQKCLKCREGLQHYWLGLRTMTLVLLMAASLGPPCSLGLLHSVNAGTKWVCKSRAAAGS